MSPPLLDDLYVVLARLRSFAPANLAQRLKRRLNEAIERLSGPEGIPRADADVQEGLERVQVLQHRLARFRIQRPHMLTQGDVVIWRWHVEFRNVE